MIFATSQPGFKDAYLELLRKVDQLEERHRFAFARMDGLSVSAHMGKAFMRPRFTWIAYRYADALQAFNRKLKAGQEADEKALLELNQKAFFSNRTGNDIDYVSL